MSKVKSFKLVSSILIDRILKDQCVSTAQLDQLSKASSPDFLHFVCTALPGPASECVFVELETPDGNGSGLGEWIVRPDGLVALVVPTNRELNAQRLRADTAEAERDALREAMAEQDKKDEARLADRAELIDGFNARLGKNSAKLKALVDRNTRLKYRINSAEQKLFAAEQRIARMEAALKYYADKDHFSTDDGLNWDSCSGEPSNILWHEEQPWFIEDGSIARAALNHNSEAESHE